MKRLLLFAALLTAGATSLTARTLSPDEALSRLNEGRHGAKTAVQAGSSRLVETGSFNSTPTYYVFSNDSQTLFVGADDLAEPLLGYVDNPNFNAKDMPPQMKWWLEQYSREIEYASARQAKGITKRERVVEAPTLSLGGVSRDLSKTATKSAISPLCKTTWDQGAPYNNLCPTKSSQRTYTGCVATAMAQVMKYHEYPTKGTGSNSYTWQNQTLSMNFANTTFDWANMLNTYASSSSGTSAQRTAISTLMKACGYAVNMEYGIDSDGGSGAMSFDIAPALVNNFGYDKATHTEFRDYYSESEWEDLIYNNLKNVGPVVYCGASSEGGHCFVCDGYNTSGYFHINWGWSGSYDGYFKLSALNPEGQGIGGYAGGYNTQQDATLGIQKPKSGSVLPESYLAIEGTLKATASSRKLTFSATNGGFYNMSSYSASFSVALALTQNGKTSYVGETSLGTVKPGYGTGQIQLSVPSSVSNGSYQASLVYKVGSGSWKPFKFHYGSPSYVNITVGSSSITVGSTGTSSGGDDSSSSTDNGTITVSKYTCSTGFTVGKSASVTATVKSTYSTSQTATVSAYLCQLVDNSYQIKAQLGSKSVTVSANSTKTATFTSTLSSDLTAGSYYLIFADGDNYIISEVYDVEVKADGSSSGDDTTGEVTVTAITPSGTLTAGSSATVKVTFKNTYKSAQTINARPVLCSKGTSSYTIVQDFTAKDVKINASASTTASYTATLASTITAGTYYLLVANSDNNIISDVQSVEVKASGSGTTTGEITVTSMSSSTGYTIGASASVTAKFKSTYSSSKTITAKALICSKSTNGYSIQATLQSKSVTVSANSTKSVTFTGTVPTSLTAGSYYLIIADSDNNILSDVQAIDVQAAASTTGEITVTSATSSTGFTVGQAVKVSATVKSTYSTTQSVKVQAYLCTKGTDSYSITESLGSTTVSVSANSTKTATISTTLSTSIAAGTYYLVICDGDNYILNTPAQVEVKAAASQGGGANTDLSINSVSTSTGFTAGKSCKLTVTFGNSTTSTKKATVTPTFYTKSGSTYTKVGALTAKSVSVTRSNTKSVTFSGTMPSLSAGTYYLQFIDANGANVGNKVYSLTVSASTSKSKYNVRSFTMQSPDNVDADNAYFNVEVEAIEDVKDQQFVALIYPHSILDVAEVSIAMFNSADLVEGTVSNISFFGSLDGLTAGKKYTAMLFSLTGESLFQGIDYVESIDFTVSSSSQSSGVDDLEMTDEAQQVQYYDLNGRLVDTENMNPGVYVRMADGKASKVVIK